jgi:hypothetical protein
MFQSVAKFFVGAVILSLIFVQNQAPAQGKPNGDILFEVVHNSWDVERDETLVYLRVYSNGFAEAHPMRKVDFRNIDLKHKQLSSEELTSLRNLLTDSATTTLEPKYSRNWGNKDFGYKFDITFSKNAEKKHLEFENFQPFLARKRGKPYPKQLEKLGCSIWKLRLEVTGEPLEKDWLRGCAELGY